MFGAWAAALRGCGRCVLWMPRLALSPGTLHGLTPGFTPRLAHVRYPLRAADAAAGLPRLAHSPGILHWVYTGFYAWFTAAVPDS